MARFEAEFTLAVDGYKFGVVEFITADDAAHAALILDGEYGNTLADIDQLGEAD